MAINTLAGSRFWISPTTVNVDTINAMDDAAAVAFFEGISDWIEVEEVEDLGEIGDTAEDVTFTAIGNRRVRHLKGTFDSGTQTVVCGHDPIDDGQQELVAAMATDFDYAFRIQLADARAADFTNTQLFYAGKVMAKKNNLGNVSNVVRRTFPIGVGTGVYEVASEQTGS